MSVIQKTYISKILEIFQIKDARRIIIWMGKKNILIYLILIIVQIYQL